MRLRIFVGLFASLVPLLALSGCSSPNRLEPNHTVRWVDPDQQPIVTPNRLEEYRNWDFVDHTLTYPIGKFLDLDWTGRRLGSLIGIGSGKQADNLNALGEVPNSSWFMNRHFWHPMSISDLKQGPGAKKPGASQLWRITRAKRHGVSAGFTIEDQDGETFVLKFDVKDWPEMASSAEVISTKFLHASGYNVPQNSIVTFRRSQLTVDPGTVKLEMSDGSERWMGDSDVDSILAKTSIQPAGTYRAMASAYLDGDLLGPFRFHGRRRDDANDRVDHEHRRELRGLRVISSWLNDADRRTSNTMNLFVSTGGRKGYVRHYLIDMGSTLGSNSRIPHLPRYGESYLWNPRQIAKKLILLGGAREEPWERPVTSLSHPAIGYLTNAYFQPGKWFTAYPNPAFEWCGNLDGYWGAKIVMSFTNAQITAIVSTGELSDPAAASALTERLIERRNMIGRYWFSRVCPLDRFRIENSELHFDDLGVIGQLDEKRSVSYSYRIGSQEWRNVSASEVELPTDHQDVWVELRRSLSGSGSLSVRIRLKRISGAWRVIEVQRSS